MAEYSAPNQQAEGGTRNFSGNSRPRPDDKQARHTRNSSKAPIQSQDHSKKNVLDVSMDVNDLPSHSLIPNDKSDT